MRAAPRDPRHGTYSLVDCSTGSFKIRIPIQDQDQHQHFSHSGRSASEFGLDTIPFPYQWENTLRLETRAYADDSAAHRSPAKGGLIQLVRLSSNILLPPPIPMMNPVNYFYFLFPFLLFGTTPLSSCMCNTKQAIYLLDSSSRDRSRSLTQGFIVPMIVDHVSIFQSCHLSYGRYKQAKGWSNYICCMCSNPPR